MHAYIVDAVRTAGGKREGALKDWHPADLGAAVLNALTDRTGIETGWRGERVVFPRSALAGVHRRTRDRKRSYMVGGIAAGLVAAVGIGFNVTGGGSATNGGSTTSPK